MPAGAAVSCPENLIRPMNDVLESRLQPVKCLPGPRHPARKTWSGWSRDSWAV